jgi:hypothetical protein
VIPEEAMSISLQRREISSYLVRSGPRLFRLKLSSIGDKMLPVKGWMSRRYLRKELFV